MCWLKCESSSGDRISDLPEFIKHQILSYLPVKDSVQTSVLSKGWNSTWKFFPILDFQQENYLKVDIYSPQKEQRIRELPSLIDASLQRFAQSDLRIQKLFIDLSFIHGHFVPLVDAWLPSALRSGVSELFFSVGKMYPLPEEAFSAASNGSKFFKLDKMSICKAIISEKIIQDITRNCPNIRNFFLSSIRGVESFEISGLRKLESLKIYSCLGERIFVNAPSLKSFTYHGRERIPKPCAVDLTACGALKSLDLRNCSISDNTFNLHIARFRLLETLCLLNCDKLQIVKISLPRLKFLRVGRCDAVKSFHIDAPTLSEFTLHSVIGEFPLFSWKVLVHCDTIDFKLIVPQGAVVDSSWFLCLRRFLKTLTGPRRSKLRVFFDFHESLKTSFEMNMVREAEYPSLVEVEHLVIPNSPLSMGSTCALMEGLLWSCHPKVLSFTNQSSLIRLTEVLCEKVLQSEGGRLCCSWIPFKCWRHSLKAVKIDFIGDFSPKEEKGGIEREQFYFVSNQNLDFWINKRNAQFSLEWD